MRCVRLVVGLGGVVACSIAALSCSGNEGEGRYVSRAAPNSHVFLVPLLDGGQAGWCMASATSTARGGGAGCSDPPTSTGPIFAETCGRSETATDVYVLTRTDVSAVAVDGGRPIPTRVNPTLPDGLRAAAIALYGPKGQPPARIRPGCPEVIALNGNGIVIQRGGQRGATLSVTLPGTQLWNAHPEPAFEACSVPMHESRSACRVPTKPPPGACRLVVKRALAKTTARGGAVATEIRPSRNVFGQAFLSCVSTEYLYLEEQLLDAAVLLDAAHPDAILPPLPAMKPLAGHSGIFEAPGWRGEIVARRIPGAWLVVEESDEIGLRVPVQLLERLHATIHL
jgi:hypothetical protein